MLALAAGLVRGSAGGFARVCAGGFARIGATALGRRSGAGVCRAPARALLCPGSIRLACDSGMFSAAQLEYMRKSGESCDARDVVWHRAVAKLVDAREDRAANNEIMHALDARVAAVPAGAAVGWPRGKRGKRRERGRQCKHDSP